LGAKSGTLTRAALARRDAADPLAGRREAFALPDGVIYLDGNSLGALPKATPDRLEAVLRREWGDDLIRSWNTHGWIEMPGRIGDKIARLIGAAPGEVAAADSTSVNLFKLLSAALALKPDRGAILTEEINFPTDLYIAQGVAGLLGRELRRAPGAEIADAIDDDVAVVMLTHVNYQTGAMHDMAAITRAAHDSGALMLWDLSHSAGAVPVDLNGPNGADGADFAVGCGYKYLNGGPGAPAFLFVAARHHDALSQPLTGWMGHAAPFDFEGDYRPAPGILRTLCGTPAILGLAALEVGVDLILEADAGGLREKSLALTGVFMTLVAERCGAFDIIVDTPREDARRGSQVSLRHADGYPIVQALIARGVIGDFRAPDIMRFGFAPLYLRHVDVWDAVEHLRDVLENRGWDRPEFHARAAVT